MLKRKGDQASDAPELSNSAALGHVPAEVPRQQRQSKVHLASVAGGCEPSPNPTLSGCSSLQKYTYRCSNISDVASVGACHLTLRAPRAIHVLLCCTAMLVVTCFLVSSYNCIPPRMPWVSPPSTLFVVRLPHHGRENSYCARLLRKITAIPADSGASRDCGPLHTPGPARPPLPSSASPRQLHERSRVYRRTPVGAARVLSAMLLRVPAPQLWTREDGSCPDRPRLRASPWIFILTSFCFASAV